MEEAAQLFWPQVGPTHNDNETNDMKNGNQVQQILNGGKLFQAVRFSAAHITDNFEYDRLEIQQRELAVLCYAIEQNQTYGADVLATVDAISNGAILDENHSPDLTEKSDDDNRIGELERQLEKLQRDVRYLESGPDSY